jgi:hypothetical protein
MADTWAGNTYNQCVSFKALQNGITTGGFQGSSYSALPDTRELVTVADTNTYIIGIYATDGEVGIYSTFSGYSNGMVLTKYDLSCCKIFSTSETTSAYCGGSTGEQFLFVPYINTTTDPWQSGAQLYTNRACTTAKTFAGTRWIYYYGYATSYEVSAAGTLTGNTFAC